MLGKLRNHSGTRCGAEQRHAFQLASCLAIRRSNPPKQGRRRRPARGLKAMASASPPKKVLVVGGVAGGASAAARLRRLSEDVELVVFERGPHVSFANCGLPYFVGDVIQVRACVAPLARQSALACDAAAPCPPRPAPLKDESKLLVANVAKFNNWFNIQVGLGLTMLPCCI
jgi:hypothetical protein